MLKSKLVAFALFLNRLLLSIYRCNIRNSKQSYATRYQSKNKQTDIQKVFKRKYFCLNIT